MLSTLLVVGKTTLLQRYSSSSGFESSSTNASISGTSSPSGSSIITAINNGTNIGTTITDGASSKSIKSKKVQFVEEVKGWGRLDSRQWREIRRKERREAQFLLCRVPGEQE